MNQLTEPCVVCGAPSPAHGEHHYREHDASQGKGMGGTHDHLETVCVCRKHHEMLHSKTLTMALSAGVWSYRLPSGEGRRPAVIDDGADAVEAWSDAHLAAMWADGEELGAQGFIQQARAAYAFRKRYGWAESWYAHTARLIRESTGRAVSVGAVYERAQFGLLLEAVPTIDPIEALETFGRKTASAIGRAIEGGRDGLEVLDQAIALVDQMSKTQARKVIEGTTPIRGPLCTDTGVHRCKYCGSTYTKEDEDD